MKKFNSQICTTIEQSQRLLDLGLKPETADMSYYILDDEPELLHDLRLTDKEADEPIVRTITVLKQELNRYQAIYGRL